MNEIRMIPIDKLEAHPNNPRKDLGDLTELTDSIRQIGVLQNLTVIPSGDKYRIIIGHRRHKAALDAGLKELPAVVTELSEREQQQIMLTENLQRNDLTFMEQADGFQLLMDLGATVEEIAKDTGFAESTIYHRLNIAKLDKDAIKEAEKNAEENGTQLSVSDFIILEQIKDVKTRDELLSEYGGTSDLKWQVSRAAKEEKEKERVKHLVEEAEKKGMKKGDYFYSWNAGAKVKDYKSGNDIKKNLPKTDYYGINHYGTDICFYSYKTKEELAKEKEEQKDSQNNKAEEIRKNALKEIGKQEKQMKEDLVSFLESKIENAEGEAKEILLAKVLRTAIYSWEDVKEYLTEEEIEKGPSLERLIIAILKDELEGERLTSGWDGSPTNYGHATMSGIMEYLEPMGFTWKPTQKKLLEGNHELQKAIKNRFNQED